MVWVRTHTPMKKGPPTAIGLSWELLQAAGLVAEDWADLDCIRQGEWVGLRESHSEEAALVRLVTDGRASCWSVA